MCKILTQPVFDFIFHVILNVMPVFSPLFRVCYDRAPKHRLALTFVLSALWHGVYPGYYFTFLTAIPITMAARAVSSPSPLEIQMNTPARRWKTNYMTEVEVNAL